MIPPPNASTAEVRGQEEHQEQVADLRHRRIGDKQLQPLLTQSERAAEEAPSAGALNRPVQYAKPTQCGSAHER
jgi:hypothetical protein